MREEVRKDRQLLSLSKNTAIDGVVCGCLKTMAYALSHGLARNCLALVFVAVTVDIIATSRQPRSR